MTTDKSILIVEDSADDEVLIRRSLGKYILRNTIDVVHDGAEALDFLFCEGKYDGQTEQLPTVVLLDLKLPKVHGLDVLKRLRADKRTKHLPVVILTSSDEQEDLLNGYELWCNSYVRKPVEFSEFSEAVSTLGLYWFLLNEPPPQQLA